MVDATVPGVEVQFYVVPRTVLVVVVVLVSFKRNRNLLGFPPYTLSLGGAIRAESNERRFVQIKKSIQIED